MVSGDALQPTTRAAMERLRNEIATNKALGPHGGSVDELLRDIEAVCDGLAQQQATIDTLRKALAVFTHQKHWAHFAADFTSACCRYCKARGDGVTDVVHADDCPIVVATRQALQESRGQTGRNADE